MPSEQPDLTTATTTAMTHAEKSVLWRNRSYEVSRAIIHYYELALEFHEELLAGDPSSDSELAELIRQSTEAIHAFEPHVETARRRLANADRAT